MSIDASILARLESLERRPGRGLVFVLGVVSGVLIAFAVMAFMPLSPSHYAVEEFTVRDADGRRRITLGLSAGTPLLEFFDERGSMLARFGVLAGAPVIEFANPKNPAAPQLFVRPDRLSMQASDSSAALLLDVSPVPRFELRRADGAPGLLLHALPEGLYEVRDRP